MPVSRTLLFGLLIGLMAAPASAADPPRHRPSCLSKAEQRAAVASHRAVPLAHAIKSLHGHHRGVEIVRARLCRQGDRLAYVLTLLARNGKVTRATVDAASGKVIKDR